MNKKLAYIAVLSFLSTVCMSVNAATMAKAEYKSAKSQISADYKSAKAACGSLVGNKKDICVAEAKGTEKVAKADLEARYTGKEKAQYNLQIAKADAAYGVAKQKCDDMKGNDKDVCIKEAKAAEVKSKEDAKLYKKVKSATKESIEDRMNADYKVAIEKCDALAGDAKTQCVNNAKTSFKKN